MLKTADQAIKLAKEARRLRQAGLTWLEVEEKTKANKRTIQKYLNLYVKSGESGVLAAINTSRKSYTTRHSTGGLSMSKTLTEIEAIQLAENAVKLKARGYTDKKIAESLERQIKTVKRWTDMYEKGGEQAIKAHFKDNKKGSRFCSTGNKGITALFAPEFNHCNLWGLALYGKQ